MNLAKNLNTIFNECCKSSLRKRPTNVEKKKKKKTTFSKDI